MTIRSEAMPWASVSHWYTLTRVFELRRKRVLGCEAVVGCEHSHSARDANPRQEVSVRVDRSGRVPAPMKVEHHAVAIAVPPSEPLDRYATGVDWPHLGLTHRPGRWTGRIDRATLNVQRSDRGEICGSAQHFGHGFELHTPAGPTRPENGTPSSDDRLEPVHHRANEVHGSGAYHGPRKRWR